MHKKRNTMKPRVTLKNSQRRKVLKHNIHKKIVARRKSYAMAVMMEMDEGATAL